MGYRTTRFYGGAIGGSVIRVTQRAAVLRGCHSRAAFDLCG